MKHPFVDVNKLISYQERTCKYVPLQCFSFWCSEYAIEILLNLLQWLINLTFIDLNFYRSKCIDWHMISKIMYTKSIKVNYAKKQQKTTKKPQKLFMNFLGEKTIWIARRRHGGFVLFLDRTDIRWNMKFWSVIFITKAVILYLSIINEWNYLEN